MNASHRARRAAAAVGAAAFVVGLAWASIGAVPFGKEPDTLCPGYLDVEGSSYETRYAWWPPGALECTYTTPAGATHTSTYVPWQEWATVAACALVLSVAVLALVSLVRPPERGG